MKTRILIVFAGLLLFFPETPAQTVAAMEQDELILDNGSVKRTLVYDREAKGLFTSDYVLYGESSQEEGGGGNGESFVSGRSPEFAMEVDGAEVNSLEGWDLVSMYQIEGAHEGEGAKVILERADFGLRVTVTYLLYPGLPVVRKKLDIVNTGMHTRKLESPDLELLRFNGSATYSWVMNDFARQKSLGQFEGNWYDPVVVVHEFTNRRGIILGNEAPGVMKRTTAFLSGRWLTAGLTHSDQLFGFRKWLARGESWESTWVFSGLYHRTDDPYVVLNGPVSDLVRRHLGIRLEEIAEKPVFVYNTWEPFRKEINESMIYEVVDAAAECGMEEFVIDDGWQTEYGDWEIDREKFPNGLKPVFDYIKSKGMKPGLWISIAGAAGSSRVVREHPEWLVRKADGSPINLHSDRDRIYREVTYSMCMSTGWRDYIKGIILGLVKEHGLEYLKGDFAVVTGAYTTDKTRSGCHATDHPHKDREESLLSLYRNTWQLFDELHEEAPDLFIDCTFETMGAYQLIDLDMCKHAEGCWLSNYYEAPPAGALRVRHMAWWRTPVIPATALVIGNQRVDDPDFLLSLKSLSGSLPIVLGDPRELTAEERGHIKQWSVWLREMEQRHGIMSFRQDLPGFGEPREGSWDGFQRINTETGSGGLAAVFTSGADLDARKVTFGHLDPEAVYEVLRAPRGERIARETGHILMEEGIGVAFDEPYDGVVFELRRVE